MNLWRDRYNRADTRWIRLLALVLLVPSTLRAEPYPTREGNAELLLVEDPYVEIALRSELIGRAKKSVEIISLAQALDQSGQEVVSSLRDAANRGVEVTAIYDRTSSMVLGDLFQAYGRTVADANLACPGSVYCVTRKDKLQMGLTPNDFFHEKIMIIDRGTPNEVIFFGGRNQSDFDLNSLDAGFILRPIDPSKPYGGTDMKRYYDKVRDFLAQYVKKREPVPAPERLTRKVARPRRRGFLRTAEQQAVFDQMLKVLDAPARSEGPLEPFQFRPETLQMVGNDAMTGASREKRPGDLMSRLAAPNPVSDRLAELLRSGRRATLLTYIVKPTAQVKEALVEMLKNGGTVRFVTNGRSAHRDIWNPFAAVRGITRVLGATESVLDTTLREVIPLMEGFNQKAPQVELHLYNSDKVAENPGPEGKYRYQHVKAIVVDDKVVTGVDNFTWASAARNNEYVVVVGDPRFARAMEGFFESRQHLYDTTKAEDAWRIFLDRPWLSDRCQKTLSELY